MYITLVFQGKGIFLTARGQDINRQPNILYITTDHGRSWTALHEFVNVRSINSSVNYSVHLCIKMNLYKYSTTLTHFVYFQSECECYDKDKHDFLIHQLNLYKALCYVCISFYLVYHI